MKKIIHIIFDCFSENNRIIYIPTFKEYCIGVESNGHLTVEMKHKSTI